MGIEVTATERRFEVRFPYNAQVIANLKAIKGAYWNSIEKIWCVPIYRQREMEEFCDIYKINKTQKMVSAMEEFTGVIPPLPELKMQIELQRPMFAFQESGVAYNLEKLKTIIGDQMGLGKTTQAIVSVFARNAFPCLVICQASKKLDWQEEWKTVTGLRAIILTPSIKESWPQYHKVAGVKIFITNYESLKKYFVLQIEKKEDKALTLKDIVFKENINLLQSILIDESHKVKDGRTQAAKFCIGIARKKEQVHLLTGTPVVNRPKDLISQLSIIGKLHLLVDHIPITQDGNGKYDYSGYQRFIMRYCEGGNGSSNLRELNYRLNLVGFYRREKSEVLKDLPPKIRQVVRCEITNRQEYEKAENEFAEYLRTFKGCTDAEIRKKMRAKILVQMGVLKGISARGKIEAVRDYIDECIEAGEKVIMFAFLHEIINSLHKEYPEGTLIIHGGISLEDRAANVKKFQNDAAFPLMILNYKSGGTGLNLYAASRVGFIEFPWHYADCEQCEDRAHRIGQLNSVQAAYFLGVDTIDEYCYKLIQEKKTIGNTVTGANDEVPTEIVDQLLNLFSQR